MNRKTKRIQLVSVGGIVLCILVGLSGCTTNQTEKQTTNDNAKTLLGTWTGSLQMPLFSGENNTTLSQIIFTSDSTEMFLTSGKRTFTMNYTYTATSDTLTLTPLMNQRNGFGSREPFNGTAPPNGTLFPGYGTIPPNGTRPPGNETWPLNGTNPPFNRTWPSNGTRPPGEMRPSMTITFNYVVDEQARVLLLNNVQFTKV